MLLKINFIKYCVNHIPNSLDLHLLNHCLEMSTDWPNILRVYTIIINPAY